MQDQEPQGSKPPEVTSDGVITHVPIRELVWYYLRLGMLGFGGPVALVGLMEKELVGQRKWLTREEMRESIAMCQSSEKGNLSLGNLSSRMKSSSSRSTR